MSLISIPKGISLKAFNTKTYIWIILLLFFKFVFYQNGESVELIITEKTQIQDFGFDKDSVMQLSRNHYFVKLILFNYELKRAYKTYLIFDCEKQTFEFLSEFEYNMQDSKVTKVVYIPLEKRKIEPVDPNSHLYLSMHGCVIF